jgi:hypothetical protein
MKIYTLAKLGKLMKKLDLRPGSLFPLEFGHRGVLINMMLYDYWHGNGYKLDLVNGCFVEDSATQTKGTHQCNPPDSQKET